VLTTVNLIKDKRNQVYRLDIRCDKRGKKRGEGSDVNGLDGDGSSSISDPLRST
jgi:hypothetical protein